MLTAMALTDLKETSFESKAAERYVNETRGGLNERGRVNQQKNQNCHSRLPLGRESQRALRSATLLGGAPRIRSHGRDGKNTPLRRNWLRGGMSGVAGSGGLSGRPRSAAE